MGALHGCHTVKFDSCNRQQSTFAFNHNRFLEISSATRKARSSDPAYSAVLEYQQILSKHLRPSTMQVRFQVEIRVSSVCSTQLCWDAFMELESTREIRSSNQN